MENYLKGYAAGILVGIGFVAILGIMATWMLDDVGPTYPVAVGEENAGPGLEVVDGDAQDGEGES